MADSQYGDGTSRTKCGKGTSASKREMVQDALGASRAPCGACKFLRRKCSSGCLFAPYFGTEQGADRFAAVHKVFGASNVSKLLSNVPASLRQEAAMTISYEAEARLLDPVYGCVSTITALQQKVEALEAQVTMMQTQQMDSRFAYASALQNTQHQQLLQQTNFNVAMQPTYSNNPTAYTTNLMSNFNNAFNLEMETTPSSHNLEPLQHS